MNLDELQIKVSIELKDLEKQLNKLTKSIDKTLGPKTMKKLMQDNHRVIKTESLAINKTLNKAFEVDFKKFNTNLNSAMNQAKLTVRSACNDIRRELNAALNVKANIRVTGKTSITGSATGSSSGSTVASSMASSQYLGAMIIKATNAIIKVNNANTTKLEQAINNLAKRFGSATKKTNPVTKTGSNNIQVNVPEITVKPEIKEVIVKPEVKVNVPDVIVNVTTSKKEEKTGTDFILGEAGEQISVITQEMKDAVKVINIFKRNFSNLLNNFNTKQLGTGSYGNNLPQTEHINFTLGEEGELFIGTIERMKAEFKALKLLTTSGINFELGDTIDQLVSVVELMKKIHSLRRGLYSDARGFEMGDSTSEYHTGRVIDPETEITEKIKQIPEIIEGVWREIPSISLPTDVFNFDTDEITAKVRESNEAIKQAFKDVQNLRKQSNMPLLEAPIEEARVDMELFKEVVRQAIGIMRDFKELSDYFNSDSMDLSEAAKGAAELSEALINIEQTASKLDDYGLEGFQISDGITDELKPFVDTLEKAWILIGKIVNYNQKPKAPESLKELQIETVDVNDLLNPPKPETPQIVKDLEDQIQEIEIPISVKDTYPGDDAFAEELKRLEDEVNIDTTEAQKQLSELDEILKEVAMNIAEVMEAMKLVNFPEFELAYGSVEDLINSVTESIKTLTSELEKLDKIKIVIDTSDAEKELKDLLDVSKAVEESLVSGDYAKEELPTSQGELSEEARLQKLIREKELSKQQKRKKPPKPTIMGFGFGAYKNELEMLANLAKKVASRIKKALSGAFNSIKTGKLHANVSNALNKVKSIVSRFSGKVRPMMNKAFDSIKTGKLGTSVSNALNKAKTAVSKFSGKVRPILDKAFSGIKASKLYNSIAPALNKAKAAVSKFAGKVGPTLSKAFSKVNFKNIGSGISKGLNAAKGALSKFASGCKTIWGKVKQTFSKGASDATKATGKLTSGLKGLLSQMFGFLSLAGLIGLGKQLIQQSQELAQAEVKLASLMKQRMGATNDTVLAIRQLAEEQAKLGVVSETAMKTGAQQLARYVHSAQALKTLMPAIANLTAARGGVMATPQDAEEIATQLGEAIREGTTTPLEQSGIYLSEAEIQKFAALRTEEERAAYLADVIAKNVGNINQALANTPHGAIAQLKNNFQSLLGTLGIFLANVLKPIVQWLNTIVVACNNALKGLGKLLGFDMTGGAESVPDIGTGGGGGGSTPVDTTTPSTPTTSDIDTGGIDDAKDSYDDAKKAADEATEANEKFKGSLMGFDEINILSDNTQKSYDPDKYNPDEYTPEEYDPTDITPGVGGQLPAVGDLKETDSIFGKLSDKMKAFLDEIIEPFKNAWDNLGDRWISAWDKLKTSFGNFCSSLAKFMKSVWDNGGKELVEHLAEIGLAIGIAAMEIGGTILDSLAKLWDHLDPEKNMNTQGFLDSLNTMTEAIRDFILDLGPLFQSLMDNGGQDVLNALGDTFMKIGKAAADVATEIVKALHGVFKHIDPGTNEFTRKLLDSLEEFIGKVGDLALSLSGALSKFMSSGGQDFLNNMADIVSIIGDLALTLGSGIIDAVNAFINGWAGQALIEGVAKALAWVSEQLVKLGDVVESIKAVFQDVIDIIVGIFEGDGEKVGRAFANLIKNAFKLTQDIMDWLIDIGIDLVEGLIEGLKKLPELLWNAVVFLYDTIVGFFKELFGIHSPSTVFAELGVNLIEGLIEGIGSMASAVWDAITAIVDSILEAFSGIGEKLSEIWESIKDSASKLWNDIKDAVVDKCKETYDNVKEKYENIKKTVSDKLEELKEKSSDTWTKVKEKTSDLVSKLKNETEDKYNKLKDKLTETMENWRKNSEDKWNKIKEKTSDLVSKLKTTVEDKYNKFKEALTNTMENWRQKSEEKWTNIKDKTTQLTENLKTTVEDKYNKFKNNLTTTLENWRQNSEEKWTNIKDKTTTLAENLRTTVENKYNTLKTNLASRMSEIKSDMETKWNNIKETVSTKVENLRTTVENKYNTLKTNLGNKLNEIKSNAQTKWEEVKTTTVNKVSEVVSNATTKYGEMKTNFTNKMNEVKSALGTKWEELKTNAKSGTEGMVKKAGEGLSGLSKTLTDAIDKAKTAASNAWDKVKDVFSGKINMPTLPKLEVEWETFSSSWFPDMKIPRLKWNARGGIIDGITPLGFANGALQMGGEAGKEMVVPLENTSFTTKIAQAMGQAVDNAMARNMNNNYGSAYNTTNDNRDIVLQINDREFARASINSINKLQRESGKTLLNI